MKKGAVSAGWVMQAALTTPGHKGTDRLLCSLWQSTHFFPKSASSITWCTHPEFLNILCDDPWFGVLTTGGSWDWHLKSGGFGSQKVDEKNNPQASKPTWVCEHTSPFYLEHLEWFSLQTFMFPEVILVKTKGDPALVAASLSELVTWLSPCTPHSQPSHESEILYGERWEWKNGRGDGRMEDHWFFKCFRCFPVKEEPEKRASV